MEGPTKRDGGANLALAARLSIMGVMAASALYSLVWTIDARASDSMEALTLFHGPVLALGALVTLVLMVAEWLLIKRSPLAALDSARLFNGTRVARVVLTLVAGLSILVAPIVAYESRPIAYHGDNIGAGSFMLVLVTMSIVGVVMSLSAMLVTLMYDSFMLWSRRRSS